MAHARGTAGNGERRTKVAADDGSLLDELCFLTPFEAGRVVFLVSRLVCAMSDG